MNKAVLISIIIGLISINRALPQTPDNNLYHFRFVVSDKSDIDNITLIISIDNVVGDTVYAYANNIEFNKFKKLGIAYEFIPETKSAKAITMATTVDEMGSWDRYPTYEVYEQMMQNFATQYPEICVLEEIGTLSSGRKLLSIKISDNATDDNEPEPEVFFTSTMHGDETGGYVVLLRLIDYFLSNYNVEGKESITNIINNSEIWINPLANPNGTYYGGNASVSSARRYNGNNVDLNRNFPDPENGQHPDGNSYQEETQFMMDFADKHHFSIGINIHGGAEVVNYPWDTWHKRAADDAWWQYVGGNYRDSAQANSPAGYLTGVSNGLTNGYDWYSMAGGRQDYMNYFKHCREFTLEISGVKLYSSSSLPTLWNSNRAALIGYITESLYGIHGKILTDKNKPVFAKIEVLNHDIDNSEVYSDNLTGFFTRYLKAGTYNLQISATGYTDTITRQIEVKDAEQVYINHVFKSVGAAICLDTSKIAKEFYLPTTDSIVIPIINCSNKTQLVNAQINNNESTAWVQLKTNSETLNPQQKWFLTVYVNNAANIDTLYSCSLIIEADSVYTIQISANFGSSNKIVFDKNEIANSLVTNTFVADTITISKADGGSKQVIIKAEPEVEWLNIIDDTIIVEASQPYKYIFEINSAPVSTGFYKTVLQFNDGAIHTIPVNLLVDTVPLVKVQNYHKNLSVNKNSTLTDTFYITNKGGGLLEYSIDIADNDLRSKITVTPNLGSIKKLDKQTHVIEIPSELFNVGSYNTGLIISSEYNTVTLPINLSVDTLPKLFVNTDTIKINGVGNGIYKDSVLLNNIGGGMLEITASEQATSGYNLIILSQLHTMQIPASSSAYFYFSIDAAHLPYGVYYSSININGKIIPVAFNLSKSL